MNNVDIIYCILSCRFVKNGLYVNSLFRKVTLMCYWKNILIGARLSGRVDVLKCLFEEVKLGIGDFRCEVDCPSRWLVSGYDCLDVVKYLFEVVGFGIDDFRIDNLYVLIILREYGCLGVVKYLFEVIGFGVDDFRGRDRILVKWVCRCGFLDWVRYFFEDVGVRDFTFNFNYCLVIAGRKGHLDIVRYLFEVVGLRIEDFGGRRVYEKICESGYIEVVRYFYEVVGLREEGFCFGGKVYRRVCLSGDLEMVRLLDELFEVNNYDFGIEKIGIWMKIIIGIVLGMVGVVDLFVVCYVIWCGIIWHDEEICLVMRRK